MKAPLVDQSAEDPTACDPPPSSRRLGKLANDLVDQASLLAGGAQKERQTAPMTLADSQHDPALRRRERDRPGHGVVSRERSTAGRHDQSLLSSRSGAGFTSSILASEASTRREA